MYWSHANRSRAKAQNASILVMVLVALGIVCIAIGTFMSLSSQRNLVSVRSLAWNDAMPVAEAGIEEALTQIQYAMPPTNCWTLSGTNYTRTRINPFGDTNVYYAVNIQNMDPPTITSTGFVRSRLDGGYIYRTVQVTTKKPGAFPYGMLANGLIKISGSSTLDSFASCDTNYSTGGLYDPAKRHDMCKVATDSTDNPAISVGTGDIYGYAGTGAGGNVTYGAGGSVGDSGWVGANSPGGELGHVSSDINISIPDATPPYPIGTGSLPLYGSFNVNGTNGTVILRSNTNFVNGDFTISAGGALLVTNQAWFYVAGSFTTSGSGFIYQTPNASLTLYVGTTNASGNDSVTVSGSGFVNGSGNANNFSLVCLPSVKSVTISGSGKLVGTIYAPEAKITLSGSGGNFGAVVGNTIELSGGSAFHYDECLGGGGFLKYVVMSWKEL
jgi:hypothetical protein